VPWITGEALLVLSIVLFSVLLLSIGLQHDLTRRGTDSAQPDGPFMADLVDGDRRRRVDRSTTGAAGALAQSTRR